MEKNSVEYLDVLSRKALRFFGAIAIAIYLLALVYCYVHERFSEMKILAIATGGVVLLIIVTYISIGKEPKINHFIDKRPLGSSSFS